MSSEKRLKIVWQLSEGDYYTENRTSNHLKYLNYSNGWRVTCVWNRTSYLPKCVKIQRSTDCASELVIGGKLTLLGNGVPILKKKFLHVMESESTFIRIKLNATSESARRFSNNPPISLKGVVHISPFQGTFTTVSPDGTGELAKDLAGLIHPQNPTVPADVNLKCGAVSIPVHKVILSARSPVFAAMFALPLKENAENQVDITDISEPVLQTIVEYIYTGKTGHLEFSFVLELLVAAEKYQLKCLSQLCYDVMKEKVSDENVFLLLETGDATVFQDLKTYAMDYICQCPDFSVLQNTEEWKSLETSKPNLAMEVLKSVTKFKDEKIKSLKTEEKKNTKLMEKMMLSIISNGLSI